MEPGQKDRYESLKKKYAECVAENKELKERLIAATREHISLQFNKQNSEDVNNVSATMVSFKAVFLLISLAAMNVMFY